MKDLSRLTLEEKVGQLLFLGFPGPEPDPEAWALLEMIRPGGIVLSRRNIQTFDQTVRLTSRFVGRQDLPALVAVHQEGGEADRLRHLFAPIPSVAEAMHGGMAQLRLLARILGAELQACGFNTLFGPVLDLSNPGSILRGRTLAASPAATTRAGNAFIEEVEGFGVVVCGKHFPGLGAATRDPHFTLPHIEKSKKVLLMEDLLPFVNLFDVLPMIMVGHAHYPSLSEARAIPASLSPKIVQNLLRKKLRYPGVIITDDMTQGAVTSIGLTADRFMEAVEAGNDMILFSQTTPLVGQAFQTIVRSAKQSATLQNRITGSVERILDIKKRLPLPIRNRANARARILRHIEKFSRIPVVTA